MKDNTLIRVSDHTGRQLIDLGILTQTESVFIQQQTLEDGLASLAGKVLLRILKAVDYAGQQRRPVMLLGRKQSNGGFMLHLTTPINLTARQAPPEAGGKGSPAQNRNGKSTQQGQQFYKT